MLLQVGASHNWCHARYTWWGSNPAVSLASSVLACTQGYTRQRLTSLLVEA